MNSNKFIFSPIRVALAAFRLSLRKYVLLKTTVTKYMFAAESVKASYLLTLTAQFGG